MRRIARTLVAPLLVLGIAGCGGGGYGDDDGAGGTITVLAAASLTDAFTELAERFEAATPGARVELSFGASSSLREQILAGAPADVFASANPATMQAVVDAGLASDPVTFATNRLQIAVPAGNPGGVAGLDDFADAALLVGLCAEEVPCGQFAREALANAGVTPSLDTNAPDVRALLTQIESGDLDAGIVYETDVLAAGDTIDGIGIPDDVNVLAAYPIAALRESGAADVADDFVTFVRSPEGADTLTSYGFGQP